MFRVIIAGGRDFDDYQLLKATMDKLLCNITDEITVSRMLGASILPTMFLPMNGTPDWIARVEPLRFEYKEVAV